MPDLGVHVLEQATASSTPFVAPCGIPYVVGTAPVHTAAMPAKTGVPVLCTGWKDAVKKLGYSEDWEKYTLCEFMFSHFKLYGAQPVIFCNVLDSPAMKKTPATEKVSLTDHRAELPFETLQDSIVVKTGEGDAAAVLEADEDYTVLYDSDAGVCVVETLSSGTAYELAELTIESAQADPAAVKQLDIIRGISAVDACVSTAGVVPDLLCAPGWSQDVTVAAVIAAKAGLINGLFRAKALIDIDCTSSGVTDYEDLPEYKTGNNLTDENQILCWPMVTNGGRRFHLSTQLAGLMAQVDTANGGCPFESPAGKNLQIDGTCLADGTALSLTFDEVNQIAGHQGVVTALNFLASGWVAKGNYTACFPRLTDVKDTFIPISRMFDWVANTLIQTFWTKLDQPMRRRLVDDIVDATAVWLNGQVGAEHLLGARIVYEADENPLTSLLQGIIRFHIHMTPPGVAQRIVFTLEYDVDYVSAALSA